MATDPQNLQYSSPPFGLGGDYASTGAPGSPGVQDAPAGSGGGPVIADAVVSAPFGSSQLPANQGRIPVTAGDTSGFSDDTPIHQSVLLPHGDQALTTGAGQGAAGHIPHPNAGGGR